MEMIDSSSWTYCKACCRVTALPAMGALNLKQKVNMKTKALTYSVIAAGIAAAMWMLKGVTFNVELDVLAGWATAGVLLAMAPLTYRSSYKNLAVR